MFLWTENITTAIDHHLYLHNAVVVFNWCLTAAGTLRRVTGSIKDICKQFSLADGMIVLKDTGKLMEDLDGLTKQESHIPSEPALMNIIFNPIVSN